MNERPKLTAEDMENFHRGLDEGDDEAWALFVAKLDEITGIDKIKLRPVSRAGW